MDLWKQFEDSSIRQNIPIRGIVELTYQCNFSCSMCYLGEKRSQAIRLFYEDYKNIFTSLREAGGLVLTFTGGEPWAHPDADRIMILARENRFAIRIFSNGSLITRERAKLLSDLQPLSVDVSLYGASEETYERITGQRSNFSKTITGIELLREAGISVTLKIIAQKETQDEIESMLYLAESLQCSTSVSALLTPTDCGDYSPCSSMLDRDELIGFFKEWGNTVPPVIREQEDIPCTSGRNSFVLSPRGDVFPCIQIRESIGSLLKDSMKDIWNEHPQPLLQEIRALRWKNMTECQNCAYAHACFFCPGLARLETGSLSSPYTTACYLAQSLHDSGRVREIGT